MSNKTNPNHSNNAVARTDNHDVAKKAGSQSMDEKYQHASSAPTFLYGTSPASIEKGQSRVTGPDLRFLQLNPIIGGYSQSLSFPLM